MDLTVRLLGEPSLADPSARWAASGAMWLTGRPNGPPLTCASGVSTILDRVASTLGAMTRRIGHEVVVDGPALLGERAALTGLQRAGEVSCGGSTRLLRAADAWVAVALVRPDDLDLLPAWLAVDAPTDPWPAVARARHPASC